MVLAFGLYLLPNGLLVLLKGIYGIALWSITVLICGAPYVVSCGEVTLW